MSHTGTSLLEIVISLSPVRLPAVHLTVCWPARRYATDYCFLICYLPIDLSVTNTGRRQFILVTFLHVHRRT